MSPTTLTPRRRDALRALVAVLLLAGPVWIPALHLDDPTYQYERTRVVVDGGGVALVNGSEAPPRTTPSDRIVCAGTTSRACAFERHLTRNHTVLTGIYASSPGERTDTFAVGPDRYDYVQIDDAIYEPTTLANRSRTYVVANGTVYRRGTAPDGVATSGTLYRSELSLRRASPTEALADVSRDPDAVPAPIGRAAETGVGTSHTRLEVPQTPIQTGNETYYRVHLAEWRGPVIESGWIETLLVVGASIAGLVTLYRLRRRVEITYVGPREEHDSEP
jgi:hypothetical protein